MVSDEIAFVHQTEKWGAAQKFLLEEMGRSGDRATVQARLFDGQGELVRIELKDGQAVPAILNERTGMPFLICAQSTHSARPAVKNNFEADKLKGAPVYGDGSCSVRKTFAEAFSSVSPASDFKR